MRKTSLAFVACIAASSASTVNPHMMSPLRPDFDQIRSLASKEGGDLSDMLPMLIDQWKLKNPDVEFPLQQVAEKLAGPTVNLLQSGFMGNPFFPDMSKFAANPTLKLLEAAAPVKGAGAAIAAQTVKNANVAQAPPINLQAAAAPVESSAGAAIADALATPTPTPIEFKGLETKKAPLCAVPMNMSYCTGVTWAVPYQGWSEWEVYVEQTLKYYMDHLYTDSSDESAEADEPAPSPAPLVPTKIKMTTAPECVEAMKAVGCAYYFPKCNEKDEPLPPCKGLCKKWKSNLKCPGSMSYACEGPNGGSFSFAGASETACTNYV